VRTNLDAADPASASSFSTIYTARSLQRIKAAAKRSSSITSMPTILRRGAHGDRSDWGIHHQPHAVAEAVVKVHIDASNSSTLNAIRRSVPRRNGGGGDPANMTTRSADSGALHR
jgi:hypothetical protein